MPSLSSSDLRKIRAELNDNCRSDQSAVLIGRIDRALGRGAKGKRLRKVRRTRKANAYQSTRFEIRLAAMKRAAGNCEGCGLELAFGEGDCDELFGGFGRRRQKMAIENVWVLHRSCHREKTINHPTAVYWDLKALLWARRNEYKETERLLENRIPIGDLP